MKWTADQEAVVRDLYAKHTAQEIADQLGDNISRCAVLGKAFRLGLCSGTTGARARINQRLEIVKTQLSGLGHKVENRGAAHGRRTYRADLKPHAKPIPLPDLRELAVQSLHIPFEDLGQFRCHWPDDLKSDSSASMPCCGHTCHAHAIKLTGTSISSIKTESYCEGHFLLSRKPEQPHRLPRVVDADVSPNPLKRRSASSVWDL